MLIALKLNQSMKGLIFFFQLQQHCIKFVDFLSAIVPTQHKTAKRLISQDIHSNTYNYKYTFSVEIAPICKGDLVCLPISVAKSAGNINPLCLCIKVTTNIHFMDPISLQAAEITSEKFWHTPFRTIATRNEMTEFIVLDVELQGAKNGKYALAMVTVARNRDLGVNNKQFFVYSHLGNLLHAGDSVLGYDLTTANFNDDDLKSLKGRELPDVFLVRKTYPNFRKKKRHRHWKLKGIVKEETEARKGDLEKEQMDYETFLQDLEEDEDMRSAINLYKVEGAERILQSRQKTSDTTMEDVGDEPEPDFPDVKLEELLEDLTISGPNKSSTKQ